MSDPSHLTPAYRRKDHKPGIVHIGIGAFHRAHQAVYTDTALAENGGDWRIIGVSLRSTDIVDALNAQDGLFTVIERHPDGPKLRQVGSLASAIAAARGAEPVLAALADPAIRIVTITVTEKAYGIDRQTGHVDPAHPAIRHDLDSPEAPTGVIGFLVEGLARRKQAGQAPFTVVCCDNLPSNGELVRNAVIDFAERRDPELARWIGENVAFPSTMVDRITPAATDRTFADVKRLTGHDDLAAVETEPFSQWVIEDHFPLGRPAWETGGALLVDDVAPYERMKLRMLNGSHSLIAYLGQVGGYRYVRDVMADADLAALVRGHMVNAAATMPPLAGIDFDDYADDLIARFQNPEIAHETRQIAMDGTEKLPQRILEPASELPEGDARLGTFALCVAVWMAFAFRTLNDAASGGLNDPRADDLAAMLGGDLSPDEIYDKIVTGLPGWMPDTLKNADDWRQNVVSRLSLLLADRMDDVIKPDIAG